MTAPTFDPLGLKNVNDAAGKLSDPALWSRIGIGALGVVLVIVGAVIVLRQPIAAAAKTASKAGAAVATDGASLAL